MSAKSLSPNHLHHAVPLASSSTLAARYWPPPLGALQASVLGKNGNPPKKNKNKIYKLGNILDKHPYRESNKNQPHYKQEPFIAYCTYIVFGNNREPGVSKPWFISLKKGYKTYVDWVPHEWTLCLMVFTSRRDLTKQVNQIHMKHEEIALWAKS